MPQPKSLPHAKNAKAAEEELNLGLNRIKDFLGDLGVLKRVKRAGARKPGLRISHKGCLTQRTQSSQRGSKSGVTKLKDFLGDLGVLE